MKISHIEHLGIAVKSIEEATPSSTANAKWCIPPLPLFFSMNLAMVLS